METEPKPHLVNQRRFYARKRCRSRIMPESGRQTRRHLNETLDALGLEAEARVLELGCGMGRFSLLLGALGYQVTATDLSPDLLAGLRDHDCERIRTVCCDAANIDRDVGGRFDAVVGFFFLHHLEDLVPTLTAARRVLRPGGCLAFCEPNGFSPLFPVQILTSPSMRWAVDRGVLRMRPSVFRSAFETAGIGRPVIRRYGFFPRMIANTRVGAAVERGIESLKLLYPISSFQVVSGSVDG